MAGQCGDGGGGERGVCVSRSWLGEEEEGGVKRC